LRVVRDFGGTLLLGDAVQNPVDTVKQRLQMLNSPYRGVWDCAARTVRTEGVGALYRSYPTTLAMNIPFTAIHFTAYESAKVSMNELKGAEVGPRTQLSNPAEPKRLNARVVSTLETVKYDLLVVSQSWLFRKWFTTPRLRRKPSSCNSRRGAWRGAWRRR
jgi:hypothetical protein